MVDTEWFSGVGERRGRYYVSGQRLKKIRGSIQESPAPIPNPFG
jgi:hypothetical protein